MDSMLNILLLEDVPHDAELVENELTNAGLAFIARRADNRMSFLRELTECPPDIILADYSLGAFTALDALQLLAAREVEVPFILVTGTNSEEIAVACMRHGADDYILKGSLRRLHPAIENTLKKHRAEAAARRSEEQSRLITEHTRDLICLLDLDFNVLYASPSFQATLGLDPDLIQGRPCADLIHPEDTRAFRETLDEALFFREGRTAEWRLRHADGRWIDFESAGNIVFTAGGRPDRALIVSREITDRKRAEREICKLAAFPQYNPNPVLEFSADGAVTYFNEAAMAMARSLKRAHPQSILPLNTAMIVKLCLSSGKPKLHVQTPIGGRILSWSFFPVPNDHVVHCYAEEVTESLNLEAQVRQAQKMESIGQLAAGVAHDFNNILTIVQGHASLLLSATDLDEDLAESARQISVAAERGANLTRQLLLFSRKQIMQPQLLDLNEILTNVSKMLRSLVGEQVTVSRDLSEDLPAIYADPGMMEQVLVNLAVNARDAMPRGGDLLIATSPVTLDEHGPSRHPESRAGYFVCLSVRDTGHGMDAATLSHIFEPFFTTKDIGKGTGLGLATIYGIVKQHQGWIEVESQLHRGTTFKVFLPASTRAAANRAANRPKNVPGGDETILLVEDEPALRELVQEILEKKGYRVLQAATGRQALQVWERHKDEIDLLLTDMMMPEGVSGRELADTVLAQRADLKVIYSSGYSLDVVNAGAHVRDGHNFLQKPYDPETLAQIVRQCLNA